MDPRRGLQRRYDLEEILEKNGGKPKIRALNYDALAMLRNPLYVKLGQELRDESQQQHGRVVENIVNHHQHNTFSSTNDVPVEVLRQLMEQMRPRGSDVEMGDNMDDDDSGPPPGRPPEPAREDPGDMGGGRHTEMYRRNLELEAQAAEMRQQLARQAQQDQVIAQMQAQMAAQRTDPIKELVRETNTIYVPEPRTVEPAKVEVRDNTELLRLLNEAHEQHRRDLGQVLMKQANSMAEMQQMVLLAQQQANMNNQELARYFGFTLAQLAEIMNQRQPSPMEVQVESQDPPPDDKGGGRVPRTRTPKGRDRKPPPPASELLAQAPPLPKPERDRSRTPAADERVQILMAKKRDESLGSVKSAKTAKTAKTTTTQATKFYPPEQFDIGSRQPSVAVSSRPLSSKPASSRATTPAVSSRPLSSRPASSRPASSQPERDRTPRRQQAILKQMEAAADTQEKKETTRQQLSLVVLPTKEKRAASAGTARNRSPSVAPPKKARTMEDIDQMAKQDLKTVRAQRPGDGYYGKVPTMRGRSLVPRALK